MFLTLVKARLVGLEKELKKKSSGGGSGSQSSKTGGAPKSLHDLAAEHGREVFTVSDPPTDHDKCQMEVAIPFVVSGIQWVKGLTKNGGALHGLCSVFKGQFEAWDRRATMHRCGRKVKDSTVASATVERMFSALPKDFVAAERDGFAEMLKEYPAVDKALSLSHFAMVPNMEFFSCESFGLPALRVTLEGTRSYVMAWTPDIFQFMAITEKVSLGDNSLIRVQAWLKNMNERQCRDFCHSHHGSLYRALLSFFMFRIRLCKQFRVVAYGEMSWTQVVTAEMLKHGCQNMGVTSNNRSIRSWLMRKWSEGMQDLIPERQPPHETCSSLGKLQDSRVML